MVTSVFRLIAAKFSLSFDANGLLARSYPYHATSAVIWDYRFLQSFQFLYLPYLINRNVSRCQKLTTVSLDVFKIFIGHYCTHVPERVIAMERYYCGLIKQRLIIEQNTPRVYLGVRRMHIPMVAHPYIDEILATNHLINKSINFFVCLSVCLSVCLCLFLSRHFIYL